MKRRIHFLAVRVTAVAVVAAVIAIAGLGAPGADAAPAGPSARSVLVILVNWAGNSTTRPAPPDSVTPEVAAGQINGADNSWYAAVSYGQFAGWNATASGWYPIATPPLDTTGCGNAFRATIQAEGNQAAAAAGFNPSGYSVVMYYFSALPCGWGGWTVSNAVWINGSMDTAATVHELGHTLGLGHGNAESCTDASGRPVALSANCQTIEYGDVYDVMGCCQAGSFTAIQKYDLGWMSGREQDVPATGGTYTLEPLEAAAPGLQALRVTDSNETLWLEYRQPVGVDSWLSASSTDGVLIHQQLPDSFTQLGSNLLDMTPGSQGGFSDAALPAGATWADPLGHARITVNSAGPAGAQVTIGLGLGIARVPNVRGDTATEAAGILRAAGLSVTEQGIVDRTCNNLGLVIAQSPSAGSTLNTGATVRIWIGTRPPNPCP
jgi:hypothetical protein